MALDPLKVAFIADQGGGRNAIAVLQLIAAEGAQMVIHSGDFDYRNNPDKWDGRISQFLGPDFPYFASPGNHDLKKWFGEDGYQAKLIQRLVRVRGAHCIGDLGTRSACTYKGLFFILSSVGTIPMVPDDADHIAFIRDQLARATAPMRICSWHKNQHKMQIGSKTNTIGWGPYEACREGGAFIVTGHHHAYARTHLLSSFEHQLVANTSSSLVISPGRSFVVVSGLGGASVSGMVRAGPWWAVAHARQQGATFGALFCTFFTGGDPRWASCYFMDIARQVPDRFTIVSAIGR